MDDDLVKLKDTVADQKLLLSAYEKTDTGQMVKKYEIAWYAALAGWVAAILAGLGLVANLAARTPPLPPEAGAPRVIYTKEEPPHSIS